MRRVYRKAATINPNDITQRQQSLAPEREDADQTPTTERSDANLIPGTLPPITAVCAMDDANFVPDKIEHLLPCIRTFVEAAAAVDLRLQHTKCAILNFVGAQLPEDLVEYAAQAGIPIIVDVKKVLGAPIGGDPNRIANLAIQEVVKRERVYKAMGQMKNALADRILRSACVQTQNYMLRTNIRADIADAMNRHDHNVGREAARLYGMNATSTEAMLRMSLPTRLHGRGIRSTEFIAPYALWGGVANAAADLVRVLPGTPVNHRLLEHLERIREVDIDIHTNVPEILPPRGATAIETIRFYADNPQLADKAQKILTKSAEAMVARVLVGERAGINTTI